MCLKKYLKWVCHGLGEALNTITLCTDSDPLGWEVEPVILFKILPETQNLPLPTCHPSQPLIKSACWLKFDTFVKINIIFTIINSSKDILLCDLGEKVEVSGFTHEVSDGFPSPSFYAYFAVSCRTRVMEALKYKKKKVKQSFHTRLRWFLTYVKKSKMRKLGDGNTFSCWFPHNARQHLGGNNDRYVSTNEETILYSCQWRNYQKISLTITIISTWQLILFLVWKPFLL